MRNRDYSGRHETRRLMALPPPIPVYAPAFLSRSSFPPIGAAPWPPDTPTIVTHLACGGVLRDAGANA